MGSGKGWCRHPTLPRSAVPLTDVVSVTSVERFMMTSCYYPTFIIGVGVAFEVFPLTPMVLTEVLLLGLLSAGVRRARGCVMYPEGDTEQNYLARAHDLTTNYVSFFNVCTMYASSCTSYARDLKLELWII